MLKTTCLQEIIFVISQMKIRYNRITALMSELDIDNSMLASYVKVAKETVSNWRTNKQQPTLKRLHKIAEYFKVDIRDLLVPTTWPAGPSPAELALIEKENRKVTKKKNQVQRRKK